MCIQISYTGFTNYFFDHILFHVSYNIRINEDEEDKDREKWNEMVFSISQTYQAIWAPISEV